MVRRVPEPNNEPLPPPATTLEGREDQLTAQAYDLVEKRIRDGTASAQETVHFLKVGSRVNQLQLQKLERENEVLRARLAESEARRSSEDIYAKALRAFKGYSGEEPIDPEEFGDGSHIL
jgi:hypothetical protein